jgi:hypothetical protein
MKVTLNIPGFYPLIISQEGYNLTHDEENAKKEFDNFINIFKTKILYYIFKEIIIFQKEIINKVMKLNSISDVKFKVMDDECIKKNIKITYDLDKIISYYEGYCVTGPNVEFSLYDGITIESLSTSSLDLFNMIEKYNYSSVENAKFVSLCRKYHLGKKYQDENYILLENHGIQIYYHIEWLLNVMEKMTKKEITFNSVIHKSSNIKNYKMILSETTKARIILKKEIMNISNKYKTIKDIEIYEVDDYFNNSPIEEQNLITCRKKYIIYSYGMPFMTFIGRYGDDIDWNKREKLSEKIKVELSKKLCLHGFKNYKNTYKFVDDKQFISEDIDNIINTNLFEIYMDDYYRLFFCYAYVIK